MSGKEQEPVIEQSDDSKEFAASVSSGRSAYSIPTKTEEMVPEVPVITKLKKN